MASSVPQHTCPSLPRSERSASAPALKPIPRRSPPSSFWSSAKTPKEQPGGVAWEIRTTGESRGRPLREGARVTVGTSEHADLRLYDEQVRPVHGVFEVREGLLHYMDSSSDSRTLAAGVRVPQATLEEGACLTFGKTLLCCDRYSFERQPCLMDEAPLPGLVGSSLAMRQLAKEVRRVARTQVPVLIRGESGSGKDLVAKALHMHSTRAQHPLLAMNMGALSESLADSELFGHERGAFTGATSGHAGIFERAHGGTLFLDEIAELSLGSQARLLRTLENKEIRPVGSSTSKLVDVRVLTATWAPLEELVRRGAFRADLLHRLSVTTLRVPSLRERRADIPELTRLFLRELVSEVGPCELTPGALSVLSAHGWPGNVRELRNVITRAALRCHEGLIRSRDVLESLELPSARKGTTLDPQEIHERLMDAEGNVSRTARELGLARSTVRKWAQRAVAPSRSQTSLGVTSVESSTPLDGSL